MKTAYFDCFSGISGDMIIGSFIDAGVDFTRLEKELAKLNLSGYEISCSKCTKNGIAGTNFSVSSEDNHPHRKLEDIVKIIEKSSLDEKIKKTAEGIFRRLAAAESRVHNIDVDKVYFHEVGAVDSIIDICGAAICFDMSGTENVISSPVNTGTGFVKTMHGVLPVPAPATVELLKNIPVYSNGINGELTTPTGAAIIAHLASSFSPMPEMRVEMTGYGAGEKDFKIPNLLRLNIGECNTGSFLNDEITEIETAIDDMNPEFYSHIFSIILEEGAVDICAIPAVMKKNRPGNILKILVPAQKVENVITRIFTETTTSGVRISRVQRRILERKFILAETIYGSINVKIHILNGKRVNTAPEYEDCRRAALQHGVPLKEVYNAALLAIGNHF